ncbi:MAG: hypothetical protein AAF629_06400 [Chloroflexota bacterium]
MSQAYRKRRTIRELFKDYSQICLAWLLVASVFGLLMWQVYGLAMASAWALIQSEAYRPTGWSASTLKGVSRCVIPTTVTIWLVGVMYVWNKLEYEIDVPRFWLRVGRIVGVIFGIYLILVVLMRVI